MHLYCTPSVPFFLFLPVDHAGPVSLIQCGLVNLYSGQYLSVLCVRSSRRKSSDIYDTVLSKDCLKRMCLLSVGLGCIVCFCVCRVSDTNSPGGVGVCIGMQTPQSWSSFTYFSVCSENVSDLCFYKVLPVGLWFKTPAPDWIYESTDVRCYLSKNISFSLDKQKNNSYTVFH